MASNRLARRLALLNLALLVGVGPFIVIMASGRNSLHASPNEFETSSLAGQHDTGIQIDPENVRIDAFDMEVCGRANFSLWQSEQSAFGCTGESRALGQRNASKRGHVVAPRIVGGEFAKRGEFPSYVHINATVTDLKKGSVERSLICGATLIHRDLVVTAAHCVYAFNKPPNFENKTYKDMALIFGSNLLNGTGGEVRLPDRWCYPSLFNITTTLNDLAIIRFREEMNYTFEVAPACLKLDSFHSRDAVCAFAGLGKDDNGNLPNKLKTLQVKRSCREELIDQSCYRTISGLRHVTQRGDSGSPVFCYDRCDPNSSDRVKAFAVAANSWGNDSNINDLRNNVADFHKLKPQFLNLLQAIRSEGGELSDSVTCQMIPMLPIESL